jgi:hypothetical protein
MRVVNPIGSLSGAPFSTAPRTGRLRGGVLGALTNGKPNADVLLEEFATRLQRMLGLSGVMRLDKTAAAAGPGMPAPDWMIERLASGTVAVLTASGD